MEIIIIVFGAAALLWVLFGPRPQPKKENGNGHNHNGGKYCPHCGKPIGKGH